ncbi:MAG: hypothetical protein ACXVRK_00640 [Gaiellaceae bacterium]
METPAISLPGVRQSASVLIGYCLAGASAASADTILRTQRVHPLEHTCQALISEGIESGRFALEVSS